MLQSVEIVLENCEVYLFPPENIYTILRGIGKTVDGLGERLTVEEVAIYIEKNIKTRTSLEEWQKDWEERIDRDITQIWFNYDEHSEGHYVRWSNESDYENAYEKDIDRAFDKVYVISPDPEAYKRYTEDES